MDLGTINRKLKDKEKKCVIEGEFLVDMQLIWDNCKLYNPK